MRALIFYNRHYLKFKHMLLEIPFQDVLKAYYNEFLKKG